MWQFVRFTGGLYGLEATKTQDDRLDPEKATRAAARHLHDLYRQTGDWYLAMAGYNCGPMCVERAVQRTGYADFWELCRRGALPKQTQNYVPAILAMAIIAKDPASYDMPQIDQDPELEFDRIHLSAPTSLTLLADAADTPVSDIRDLNPSLLQSAAPADSDARVPKGKGPAVLSAIESVPEEKRSTWRLHRVGPGDSLQSISKQYGCSSMALLSANSSLDREWFERPREGELVLIPSAPKPERVARASHQASAHKRGASKGSVSAHNGHTGTPHTKPVSHSSQVQMAAAHVKSHHTATR
jgi:membrane-bound lytic murein transglycosylase D